MYAAIGQREYDTLIYILHEVDILLVGGYPHVVTVVLALMVGYENSQSAVEVHRYRAVLQTAVAFAYDVTVDRNIEDQLRVALVDVHMHLAAAILDLLAFVGLEKGSVNVEIDFVKTVFQTFIRDGIFLFELHFGTNSWQMYKYFGICANYCYICHV